MSNIPAIATPANSTVPDAVKAKLKEKSQDFESFYIYQFIQLMTPDSKDKLMNGGMAEDIYRQKLNEEIAKNVTHNGGFGLADKVYTELLKHQEAQ